MSESSLLKQIQVSFTNLGARLFRNNTAMGWVGQSIQYSKSQMVKVGPGDVLIRNARPLRAGLCVGSADLIGWTTLTVTSDLVGRQLAVFTAVEGKTGKTRVTTEQKNFLTAVRDSGGYAGVARSVDDAVDIINGWPNGAGE